MLGDPYKTVAEEHEIELTREEKDELNCLLNMDKLKIVDSYLNGASSSRNDKIIEISANLLQMTIFLQDTQQESDSCMSFMNKITDCKCFRCMGFRFSSEKGLNSMHDIEPDRPERVNKARDAVFSIIMVNHEGKSYDPQLVKERTLLIIEFGLTGSMMIHRDLHIETPEKIKIKHIEI